MRRFARPYPTAEPLRKCNLLDGVWRGGIDGIMLAKLLASSQVRVLRPPFGARSSRAEWLLTRHCILGGPWAPLKAVERRRWPFGRTIKVSNAVLLAMAR